MRVGSLFSGVGGFELGLERAGMQIMWQVEIDLFCRAVLSERWPDVYRAADIRDFSRGDIPPVADCPVDVVVGGFPCQPHSLAGKRKGEGDERNLWPEMLRVIRHVRPSWVIAENVPGIRTTLADRVIADLEGEGYTVWPLVVGADDVGAPHRRKRVFFVARLDNAEKLQQHEQETKPERSEARQIESGRASGGTTMADPVGEGLPGRWSRPQRTEAEGPLLARESPNGPRDMADPDCGGRQSERRSRVLDQQRETFGDYPHRLHRWPSGPSDPQHEDEPARAIPKPGLGGVTDGVPPRLERRIRRERLKALGNAVVPQVAEAIGRAILAVMADEEKEA